MGRGRFAENSAKLQVRPISLSLRETLVPQINGLVTSVALGRQTHYTITAAHLELAMREALPLVPNHSTLASAAARSKWVVSTA